MRHNLNPVGSANPEISVMGAGFAQARILKKGGHLFGTANAVQQPANADFREVRAKWLLSSLFGVLCTRGLATKLSALR